MANTHNLAISETALDLSNIRTALCRMEDSIIFSLIERAQYKINDIIYEPDHAGLGEFTLHQLKCAGSNGCYGDYFIYQTECIHSQAQRYKHPTEFNFFGPLPEANIRPSQGKSSDGDEEEGGVVLHPHSVNINKRLLEVYRNSMVPVICQEGDDGNAGSAATCDVQCLQTIATRIYYGLFVAESKFRSDREHFTSLIEAQDSEGLMAAITKPEVEKKIIERVVLKARTFSQEVTFDGTAADEAEAKYKVPPEWVGKVFEQYIMPLTKDVEVEYLLTRL